MSIAVQSSAAVVSDSLKSPSLGSAGEIPEIPSVNARLTSVPSNSQLESFRLTREESAVVDETSFFSPVMPPQETETLPEELEIESFDDPPAITRRSRRIQEKSIQREEPLKSTMSSNESQIRTRVCKQEKSQSRLSEKNKELRLALAMKNRRQWSVTSNQSGGNGPKELSSDNGGRLTSEQETWLVSYVASNPLVASGNYWTTAAAAFPTKFKTRPTNLLLQRAWMLIASRMFADTPNMENAASSREAATEETTFSGDEDGEDWDTTSAAEPNPMFYTTEQLHWLQSHITPGKGIREARAEWANLTKSFNTTFNQSRSVPQLYQRFRKTIVDTNRAKVQLEDDTQVSIEQDNDQDDHDSQDPDDLSNFGTVSGTWSLDEVSWLEKNERRLRRPDGVLNFKKLELAFAKNFGKTRSMWGLRARLKRIHAKTRPPPNASSCL